MTVKDLHPDGTTGRDEEMMTKEDTPQDYFVAFREYMCCGKVRAFKI